MDSETALDSLWYQDVTDATGKVCSATNYYIDWGTLASGISTQHVGLKVAAFINLPRFICLTLNQLLAT
jgi:hypothetical protein